MDADIRQTCSPLCGSRLCSACTLYRGSRKGFPINDLCVVLKLLGDDTFEVLRTIVAKGPIDACTPEAAEESREIRHDALERRPPGFRQHILRMGKLGG